jgi:hypothetical protein
VRTPLAIAVVLISFAVTGCGPTAPGASPAPTVPVVETPSVTPSPVVTVEPEGLTDDDYANIAASIDSGNTAALEGYLGDSVNVIVAASECCGDLSTVDAISMLDYLADSQRPWTFPADPAIVDGYRNGFYVDYFPEGAYVGISSDDDPYVVSFTIEGTQITTIFMTSFASLLTE